MPSDLPVIARKLPTELLHSEIPAGPTFRGWKSNGGNRCRKQGFPATRIFLGAAIRSPLSPLFQTAVPNAATNVSEQDTASQNQKMTRQHRLLGSPLPSFGRSARTAMRSYTPVNRRTLLMKSVS